MLDESRIVGTHLVHYLRNVDVQWGAINDKQLPEMDILERERDRFTVLTNDLLVCEGGEVGRSAIVDHAERLRGENAGRHANRGGASQPRYFPMV